MVYDTLVCGLLRGSGNRCNSSNSRFIIFPRVRLRRRTRRDPGKPLLPLLLLFLMNIVWLVFLLYCIAFYDDITQGYGWESCYPHKVTIFLSFCIFFFQFVSQRCMVIKSRIFPVYRLCESDSDAIKFMSQLFCVFTNSASSLQRVTRFSVRCKRCWQVIQFNPVKTVKWVGSSSI